MAIEGESGPDPAVCKAISPLRRADLGKAVSGYRAGLDISRTIMPELPEVETTRRGIEPHLRDQRIDRVILRDTRLRWPISEQVAELAGRRIIAITRRGKYLLMQLDQGHLIWHLGMSGSMRIQPASAAVQSHEHQLRRRRHSVRDGEHAVQLPSAPALQPTRQTPRRLGTPLHVSATQARSSIQQLVSLRKKSQEHARSKQRSFGCL